jgi:hypothetical protein
MGDLHRQWIAAGTAGLPLRITAAPWDAQCHLMVAVDVPYPPLGGQPADLVAAVDVPCRPMAVEGNQGDLVAAGDMLQLPGVAVEAENAVAEVTVGNSMLF